MNSKYKEMWEKWNKFCQRICSNMRLKFQNKKGFLCLIWTGAVLVSIKSLFVDFGIDNGYAVATSYRHISGDHMFLEMWEPHQTSAFLVDCLMLIYRGFVPSLTGVAIFLQFMGVLLWIPVIIILHNELSKHIDRYISHLICALLFVFRAKQTVFPEFSNMQIGFSVLFFAFLVKYICGQAKLRHLILAAVFLCLEIISYPTCMIAFVAAVGIILIYTEHKVKDVLVFSGVCLALGTLYVGYFVWARGLSEFINVLRLLVEADLSHGDVSMTFHQYLKVFLEGAVYIAGTLMIAATIHLCFRKRVRIAFLTVFGVSLLTTAGATLLCFIIKKQSGYEWHYCIVLVLLIVLGLFGYPFLTDVEKKIWISGMMISFSSFLAVVLLTNLPLMSTVAYLPLAAAVSMIPLSRFRKGTFFTGAILLFVLLHRGLIVCGYSELSQNSYVNEIESIVRTGPALGIICDDNTSCIYRDNVADFQRFLKSDDTVFFMTNWIYDPLVYVQAGIDVAISSTISSPTYGEKQIDYWRRYGYKTPTVIAISCYDGVFSLDRNAYLTMFEWVEEHYEWVGDGTWWRFYRIKE